MATFTCPMTIATVMGEGAREIEALVDTGAAYSMVPAHILHGIGVASQRTAPFRLADGSRVTLNLGRIQVTIDGITDVCPVIFGPEDASPIIGAVTLEALLLAVDPVARRLVPAEGLLM